MAKLLIGQLPRATPEYDPRQVNNLVETLELILRRIDTDSFRLGTTKTPASASETGRVGDIVYDSNYVYICVDTDTWKRAALSTF